MNFKRFRNYVIEPNPRVNVFVGDNEVGKSSMLEAIELVAGGSVRRVETIGLDTLLNTDAVQEFNEGERIFDNLPKLRIELYLNLEHSDQGLNGKNNSEGCLADGIRLVCEPNPDYRNEIVEILKENKTYFPYEYYTIRFSTFADNGYTGYKKKLCVAKVDSVNMSAGHATTDFIRRMYMQYTEMEKQERAQHKSAYRSLRNEFCKNHLDALNKRIPYEKNYTFGLKGGGKVELENDLMIYEDNVALDSKGTGRQIFIKTEFALGRVGENVDVILIEEPENHLSPVNLRRLVHQIAETQKGQLFITTHSSLISTRLELQNLFIMHENDKHQACSLKDLSQDTAKYFMKTPPTSIVEYALAKRVIAVEGPSEYMLLERFYLSALGCTPEEDGVYIINVRGLSFLRYLEVAKLTGCRVAIITDNDGDYQKNCVNKYQDYNEVSTVKIFFEKDNALNTFEKILYKDNKELCDSVCGNDAESFMLKNKTEAAYKLLVQEQVISVPAYIKKAVEWIKL